jgi:hypothetical protein
LGPTSVHKHLSTIPLTTNAAVRKPARACQRQRHFRDPTSVTHFREWEGGSAAAANAAQDLFDSLLPRKLLGLQLIPFRRASLRPWPDGSRSRTGDVAGIGGNSRLRPWRGNVWLRRHCVAHPPQLLGFGSNRLMSRRAGAKACPHPDQQKSGVKSNHRAHHTTGARKYLRITYSSSVLEHDRACCRAEAPRAQIEGLAREAVPEDTAARNLSRLLVAKDLSLNDYCTKRARPARLWIDLIEGFDFPAARPSPLRD